MVLEEDIFLCFCNITVDIMNFIKIMSTSNVAKLLDCSYYIANKHIKSLVDKGLLEYGYETSADEYEINVVQGYYITEKGKRDIRYRRALWKEAKLCSKCFGCGSPYDYWKGLE